MLSLLIMFFFILMMVSIMSRLARRRRMMEQERARMEAAERGEDGRGESPFSMMPFGGLLEQMMGGGGAYTYDPQTGRWVEVTHEAPPEPAADQPAQGTAQKPRRRRESRPPGLFGALGMGGMGGMGGGGEFEIQQPGELTDFSDVGGMDELKREVRDTVGLMLQHPDDAERYGIEWNGILLHGPPGVGKTFVARAIAGEYGLNLMHVSTGDLVSSLQGGSAQNIDKAFD